MVLEYYGISKTEQELIKLTGSTAEIGVSANKLIKTVKRFGLDGFIKDKARIADIKDYVLHKKVPVIVDWFAEDDGHYSVVVDIDQENIYLLDPSYGHIRAMRLDKFYRVWFDFPGNFLKSKNDLIIRRMIVVLKSANMP